MTTGSSDGTPPPHCRLRRFGRSDQSRTSLSLTFRSVAATGARRVSVALLVCLLGLATILFVAPPTVADVVSAARIEITATPVTQFDPREPGRTRFGALDFRGGLELRSSFSDFGGLSGLRMEPDGSRFVAISDRARWFRGRVIYRDNRPSAVADAETAPMIGPDGRLLTARGWYDTEALAESDGALYVGLERVHQILRFDYARDGLLARGRVVPLPPGIRSLRSNKGLECLAAAAKPMPLAGTLIAVPERGLDADGNNRGFLIGGPSPGEFAVKRSDDFDISDCVVTPDADLLLLERRFSWRQGLAMRIRRIPLRDIRPGAILDGAVLIEADMGYQIDNMEGLGAHRGQNGELILTLVSDDNFLVIQRTLLLQFAVVE